MNWRAALYRKWRMPVIWVAGTESPALVIAEAVPQATVIHVHHWHLPADTGRPIAALPARDAITQQEN